MARKEAIRWYEQNASKRGIEPVDQTVYDDRWNTFCRTYQHDKRIGNHPDILAVKDAIPRTVVNVIVTAADLVPVVGDGVSWLADGLKAVRRATKNKANELGIDLTPDVKLSTAVLTELAEIPTTGFAPSHAVEGGLQLRQDLKRFWVAWRVARDHNRYIDRV